MPAFQPYWGKLTVRNDRGDRENVGIIRSPIRVSILPDPISGHAEWLPSPRVFLAEEEPAFNILFVGHPTPANLSERLARTGHSGDRALPTVTVTAAAPLSPFRCGRQKAGA